VISFRPLAGQFRRLVGLYRDVACEAVEQWTVSGASQRPVPPARFLPGQLEKILDTEFAPVDTVVRAFRGGFDSDDGETLGFRLRNVHLVDGVLYGARSLRHLRQRQRRQPFYRVPATTVSGTLYESWIGNQWFGSWLMEDCITYGLAHEHGRPITTRPLPRDGHIADYEARLGMAPERVQDVHFDELVLFEDPGHNEGKRQRADRLRERLVAGASRQPHPGVYLLRGDAGDRRLLLNEKAIAEALAQRRGFKVIDPLQSTVGEIVEACAGARVVAGVEGSQLVHGLVTMPTDAALFVIQPPHRVVSTLKLSTDRQGQTYAFVIASGGKEEFSVSLEDVERTLDLLA
jgi:Glycosyltransferase 61